MDQSVINSTQADYLRLKSFLELRFIAVMGFGGAQIGSLSSASVDILEGWIKW